MTKSCQLSRTTLEMALPFGRATGQSGPRDDRDDLGHSKTLRSTQDEEEDDDDEEDEDDEEETEPTLKCARLTSSVSSIYKNGDSTSTFLVSGDKMVRV